MEQLNYCIYLVLVVLGAHCANATWVCKGKGVTVSDKSVTLAETYPPSPVRCIYKGDGFEMTKGDYYFEVKVGNTHNNVKVGVATEAASEQSPVKEFYYDNDLYNGCQTPLKRNFGEKVNPVVFKEDAFDNVGVIVKIHNKEMNLYVLHDGVPLGLAYRVIDSPAPLFPAILVNGQATVTFILKTYSSDIQPDKLVRSARMPNNFYKLISFTGFKTKPDCEHQQLRLRPSFTHQLKKNLNDNSQNMNIYVSVLQTAYETDDERVDGLLSRSNQKWVFHETPENDCLKSVKTVLKKIDSIEISNQRITVKSTDGKSFVADKWTFPSVTCQ